MYEQLFTKESRIAKNYALLIDKKRIEQEAVPDLSNLREVVAEIVRENEINPILL